MKILLFVKNKPEKQLPDKRIGKKSEHLITLVEFISARLQLCSHPQQSNVDCALQNTKSELVKTLLYLLRTNVDFSIFLIRVLLVTLPLVVKYLPLNCGYKYVRVCVFL